MHEEVCAMSIASELIRGRVDAVILANIMNKDSYGYEINKTIQDNGLRIAAKRIRSDGHVITFFLYILYTNIPHLSRYIRKMITMFFPFFFPELSTILINR